MKQSRAVILLLISTGIIAPVLVFGYGLVLRSQHLPVNWLTLSAGFAIFIVLIDLPLIVLGYWIGQHTNESYERLMTETLDRSLQVSTRLFVEHYKDQQDKGALPFVPLEGAVVVGIPGPTGQQGVQGLQGVQGRPGIQGVAKGTGNGGEHDSLTASEVRTVALEAVAEATQSAASNAAAASSAEAAPEVKAAALDAVADATKTAAESSHEGEENGDGSRSSSGTGR